MKLYELIGEAKRPNIPWVPWQGPFTSELIEKLKKWYDEGIPYTHMGDRVGLMYDKVIEILNQYYPERPLRGIGGWNHSGSMRGTPSEFRTPFYPIAPEDPENPEITTQVDIPPPLWDKIKSDFVEGVPLEEISRRASYPWPRIFAHLKSLPAFGKMVAQRRDNNADEGLVGNRPDPAALERIKAKIAAMRSKPTKKLPPPPDLPIKGRPTGEINDPATIATVKQFYNDLGDGWTMRRIASYLGFKEPVVRSIVKDLRSKYHFDRTKGNYDQTHSKEEIELVKELYYQHIPLLKIASMLGISGNRVRGILNNHIFKGDPRNKR